MRAPLSLLAVAAVALALLGAHRGLGRRRRPTACRGRDIYDCVLKNRFRAYVQEAKLVSGDRGESAQESRLLDDLEELPRRAGQAPRGRALEDPRPLRAPLRPALLGLPRHQQRSALERPVRLPRRLATHPPGEPPQGGGVRHRLHLRGHRPRRDRGRRLPAALRRAGRGPLRLRDRGDPQDPRRLRVLALRRLRRRGRAASRCAPATGTRRASR